MEEGPEAFASDPSLASVREHVESMRDVEPYARRLLTNALETLCNARDAAVAPVSGPLLAYGAYLESIGRLALAAHVYQVVVEALALDRHRFDPPSLAVILMQHGSVARRSGQLDEAYRSYDRARTLGVSLDDQSVTLRAQTGLADVASARGDVKAAEAQLDTILADAASALAVASISPSEQDALTLAEYCALQSRGAVRRATKQYVAAINDYFAAFKIAFDHIQHETVLNELAECAAEAGFRTIARQANAYLAKTARTPVARSAALVNLLELVVLDGDEDAYNVVRSQIARFLQNHTMSAEHAAYATLYTAHGIERFSNPIAAVRAYRDVIVHARAANLPGIAEQAQTCLAALMTGGRPDTGALLHIPPMVSGTPDTLRDVASAIANMHVFDGETAKFE
jgi:tetratricopeptide (TPR) repeat protein